MKGSDECMRNPKVVLAMIGGVILSFGIGAYVGAATNNAEPGSVSDPIITKSYLEERLSAYSTTTNNSNLDSIESKIASLQSQIEELKSGNEELKKKLAEKNSLSVPNAPAIQNNFKKVVIKSGQKLVMKYGTEMVFYSGKGVFKTSNNKYILDLTERNHVATETEPLLYHIYLIRSGCNLEVTKDTVVYIRGTYSVK